MGILVFGTPEGTRCNLLRKLYCFAASSLREQRSSALHLIFRVPSGPEGKTNKRDTQTGIPFICLVRRKGLEPPTLRTGI